MEICTQVIPHSCHIPHKQLSIMVRYLNCMAGIIQRCFFSVNMNNIDFTVYLYLYIKTDEMVPSSLLIQINININLPIGQNLGKRFHLTSFDCRSDPSDL